MERRIVGFKKRTETAHIPEKKSSGALGFDLYADEDYQLHPGGIGMIDTGLTVEVPEGHTLMINVRSGIATKGIMLANGTGIIDSDYRGPVKIILYNGNTNYIIINKGERIAQCYLIRNIPTVFTEVKEVSETVRGIGGMGSTGKD